MIKGYHHSQFLPLSNLVKNKKERGISLSAVIPARNEEKTVGGVVGTLRRTLMEEVSLVDEIVVIDGQSEDNTITAARQAGASVYEVDEIDTGSIEARGKGAALWKSLFVSTGDVIICVDADIVNFHQRFVYGLAGPLLTDMSIQFVKGSYRRPLQVNGETIHDYGGRVTEILIRPLLSLFYPGLAHIAQPLAGEYGFRREAVKKIPFSSGYGVEIGLLIDMFNLFGLDALAQVDMDVRYHRNRSGTELGRMSFGILQTLLRKLQNDDILKLASPLCKTMVSMQNGGWLETEIDEKVLPPYSEVFK